MFGPMATVTQALSHVMAARLCSLPLQLQKRINQWQPVSFVYWNIMDMLYEICTEWSYNGDGSSSCSYFKAQIHLRLYHTLILGEICPPKPANHRVTGVLRLGCEGGNRFTPPLGTISHSLIDPKVPEKSSPAAHLFAASPWASLLVGALKQ